MTDEGADAAPLVEVRDLTRSFAAGRSWLFGRRRECQAVAGISFSLRRNETLGLVGESGCGKSTAGKLVLDLIPPTTGRVIFNGRDLATLDAAEWRALRAQAQLVFQDPAGALDPRIRVGAQVREPLDIHGVGTIAEREAMVAEMLSAVALGPEYGDRYPHQLSGGQQQRVVIARALVLRPDFIVCDEPVSALDVSIQAQVVNLLADLQARYGLTYLFISHDLSVVRHISDRIAVMYLGKIVELARRDDLFAAPRHPYTQALISAVPVPDPRVRRRKILLTGDPPSPFDPPAGCRFHTRCPHATAVCRAEEPALRDIGHEHRAACHHVAPLDVGAGREAAGA